MKQGGPEGTSPLIDCEAHLSRLIREISVMLRFAASSGKAISDSLAQSVAELCADTGDEAAGPRPIGASLRLALSIHADLARRVAPATPVSIETTEPVLEGFWRGLLIRNRAIRFLVYLATASLLFFLLVVLFRSLSLAPANTAPGNLGSWTVVLDSLMLLAAAALGASFYSLTTAHRYIVQRTFDPQYNQTYVIRFVLGLAAGTILGYFGVHLFDEETALKLGPPALAVIGGFAADAVAQILRRLAETLVALVRGSQADQVRAEVEGEQAAKSRRIAEKAHRSLAIAHRENAPDELKEMLTQLMDAARD